MRSGVAVRMLEQLQPSTHESPSDPPPNLVISRVCLRYVAQQEAVLGHCEVGIVERELLEQFEAAAVDPSLHREPVQADRDIAVTGGSPEAFVW